MEWWCCFDFFCPKIQWINRISGIMVSMLTLNAVDCGFEPRLGQTENCKIGIWCFSSKYAALWSNNWLAQNQKILKNKFKQWWSIIPPLYTKWNNQDAICSTIKLCYLQNIFLKNHIFFLVSQIKDDIWDQVESVTSDGGFTSEDNFFSPAGMSRRQSMRYVLLSANWTFSPWCVPLIKSRSLNWPWSTKILGLFVTQIHQFKSQSDIKHIMTSQIKTIMSVLKASLRY